MDVHSKYLMPVFLTKLAFQKSLPGKFLRFCRDWFASAKNTLTSLIHSIDSYHLKNQEKNQFSVAKPVLKFEKSKIGNQIDT